MCVDVLITNASVEGMHRKGDVVRQRAYGYRAVVTVQPAFYQVMRNLQMLETTHSFL